MPNPISIAQPDYATSLNDIQGAGLYGSRLMTKFTPADRHWAAEGGQQDTAATAEDTQNAGHSAGSHFSDDPAASLVSPTQPDDTIVPPPSDTIQNPVQAAGDLVVSPAQPDGAITLPPGDMIQDPVHSSDLVVSSTQPDGAIILHPGDNIQEAVQAGGEGAAFWLEAGVYRMQEIAPLNGQSFHGAAGAVLNGSRLLTEFTQVDGHWVAEGQTQEGERRETDEAAEGAQRAGYPDAIYVNDHPLTPVDSLDHLTAGTFFFDYDQDRVYFGDNPNGQTVEAAVSRQAIASEADNVTVSGLIVEKYATPTQVGAISGGGEGWVVSHNEVRLNYGVGIDIESGGKIQDNFVHDNGQMGLGGGGSNVLVEGNEIASNGFWSGIDIFWEGGGAKFTETDGLMVRGNYTHDNNGYGLWTDIDNVNATYEGNRVEYNSGGGINHEISYAASIHDNTFVGNGGNGLTWLWGSAIQVQNSQGVEIFNNFIDASSGGNGIGLLQQDRGEGAHGDYVTHNNNVHDNTIILSPESGVGAVADYDVEGLVAGGNVFSNNVYQVEAAEDQFAFGDFQMFEDFLKMSSPDSSDVLVFA